MKSCLPAFLPVVLGLIIASPAAAGDLSAGSSVAAEAAASVDDLTLDPVPWRFAITPYLWVPGQHGDVTVRGRTGTVDMDVWDTLDLLTEDFNAALVFHAEASKGPLAIFFDAMYLNLEGGKDTPAGTATASYTQGFYELGASYATMGNPAAATDSDRAKFTLEPLGGIRVYQLDMDIVGPAGNVQASGSETWADAFVGIRGSARVSETCALFARGDIGAGGSDLAWNIYAGLTVKLASWFSLEGGYRWMDIDYSDGSGTDQVAYDMRLDGPFLGMTFRF